MFPILYQLNDNNIILIIEKSLKYANIQMLKFLYCCVIKLIDNATLIYYMINSCEEGHINVVKYLYKNLG